MTPPRQRSDGRKAAAVIADELHAIAQEATTPAGFLDIRLDPGVVLPNPAQPAAMLHALGM